MAISFPTFEDQEILTAEKLNSFIQALEDKFNSGFGSADINWPLVAEDSLIMGTGAAGYEIVGGTKILKLVNAAAYDTLEAAVTAAGTSGCVFIPPNTTIITDGVTLPLTGAIIGAGPSSVLRAAVGASYVLNTAAGGSCLIANLKIDGRIDVTSANGVRLVDQSVSVISNVYFVSCDAPSILMNTRCEQINITGCHFWGGGDDHIFADDLDGCTITGCTFENSAAGGISMVASGGASYMRNIAITGNSIYDCVEECIKVVGSGGYSVIREGIVISGNQIDHAGGGAYDSILVGNSSGQMQNINVSGNQVQSASQDAISVWSKDGSVQGNNVVNAARHGVNCTSSVYMTINGNSAYSAANIGIRAVNTSTNVVISDNNVLDCNTALNYGAKTHFSNNAGAIGTAPGNGWRVDTTSRTVTIPANHLKVGDSIRITAGYQSSAGSGPFNVDFDGQDIGSTYSGSATGARFVDITAHVINSTSLEFYGLGLTDARPNNTDGADGLNVFRGVKTGLSFTAAITVVAKNAGLTTARFAGMEVRVYRLEDQS